MVTSPDPVSDARGYQEHLVGLVGSDDPADIQSATPGLLRSLVVEAGQDLRTRPEPSEWSVLECLAHVVDAELVASGRYRWILAHDEPDLPGYDQDRWVDRLHQPPEDVEPMLELFEALRRANLELWRRAPAELRNRVGIHRERGPESYGLTFTLIAGHDRFHLAQARRALARVRLRDASHPRPSPLGRPSMRDEIHAVLDRYADRYMAADPATIADMCEVPFVAVRGGIPIHLADRDAVVAHFTTTIAGYQAAGAAVAEVVALEIVEQGDAAAHATATWEVRAADGRVIRRFRTSYQLVADPWRLAAYVNHDSVRTPSATESPAGA